MTAITQGLVQAGMSIYDIDRTEFDSLWEFLTYKPPEQETYAEDVF